MNDNQVYVTAEDLLTVARAIKDDVKDSLHRHTKSLATREELSSLGGNNAPLVAALENHLGAIAAALTRQAEVQEQMLQVLSSFSFPEMVVNVPPPRLVRKDISYSPEGLPVVIQESVIQQPREVPLG